MRANKTILLTTLLTLTSLTPAMANRELSTQAAIKKLKAMKVTKVMPKKELKLLTKATPVKIGRSISETLKPEAITKKQFRKVARLAPSRPTPPNLSNIVIIPVKADLPKVELPEVTALETDFFTGDESESFNGSWEINTSIVARTEAPKVKRRRVQRVLPTKPIAPKQAYKPVITPTTYSKIEMPEAQEIVVDFPTNNEELDYTWNDLNDSEALAADQKEEVSYEAPAKYSIATLKAAYTNKAKSKAYKVPAKYDLDKIKAQYAPKNDVKKVAKKKFEMPAKYDLSKVKTQYTPKKVTEVKVEGEVKTEETVVKYKAPAKYDLNKVKAQYSVKLDETEVKTATEEIADATTNDAKDDVVGVAIEATTDEAVTALKAEPTAKEVAHSISYEKLNRAYCQQKNQIESLTAKLENYEKNIVGGINGQMNMLMQLMMMNMMVNQQNNQSVYPVKSSFQQTQAPASNHGVQMLSLNELFRNHSLRGISTVNNTYNYYGETQQPAQAINYPGMNTQAPMQPLVATPTAYNYSKAQESAPRHLPNMNDFTLETRIN